MEVPLLDLKAQHEPIEKDIRAAIDTVLTSQRFIMGPEVESLEREVASYTNCKFGIGVSSGSDALIVALMALGVGDGDEIVTSPYTFFATVGAIERLGAKPVFVDIDPKTYNLDVTKVEDALTPKTKAIIPVHLFGQACDMDPLLKIATSAGVPIIEDAAQAIGTEYQDQRLGGLGKIGCFSFFPSKNLGAMGDAGLVTTNDDAMADKIRVLRSHGSKPKYYHKLVGGNFRIDAMQAAILRVKLKHLDQWTKTRQENADRYDNLFAQSSAASSVTTPFRRPGDRHIFNQYVIRVPKRDELKSHLKENGVGAEVYYPVPMHLQECFSHLGHKEGSFPESEKAANESLAIPVYPGMTTSQQEYVVQTIASFFSN